MTSQNSLSKPVDNYLSLSSDAQEKLLRKLYCDEKMTFAQIATLCGTYSNKVIRDARKFGIQVRTMSETQSLLLKKGDKKHPTKGTVRPKSVRDKIGKKLSEAYAALPDKVKQYNSKRAKEQWENKTEEEKADFHKKAARGIRKAAVDGSKLEKYLLAVLVENGYRVEFHKTHNLQNDLLHIDLFLPEINIAIEVDGPVHSRKIWTYDEFNRRKMADYEKTSLVLSKGLIMIRVKQDENLTRKFKEEVANKLLTAIKNVVENKPDRENCYIEI